VILGLIVHEAQQLGGVGLPTRDHDVGASPVRGAGATGSFAYEDGAVASDGARA
jgi:hypothetical protein